VPDVDSSIPKPKVLKTTKRASEPQSAKRSYSSDDVELHPNNGFLHAPATFPHAARSIKKPLESPCKSHFTAPLPFRPEDEVIGQSFIFFGRLIRNGIYNYDENLHLKSSKLES
jgi:hypothetical protein